MGSTRPMMSGISKAPNMTYITCQMRAEKGGETRGNLISAAEAIAGAHEDGEGVSWGGLDLSDTLALSSPMQYL